MGAQIQFDDEVVVSLLNQVDQVTPSGSKCRGFQLSAVYGNRRWGEGEESVIQNRKKISTKKREPPPALSCDCHQHKKARLLIFRGQSLCGGNPLGGIGNFIAFRWGQCKMG